MSTKKLINSDHIKGDKIYQDSQINIKILNDIISIYEFCENDEIQTTRFLNCPRIILQDYDEYNNGKIKIDIKYRYK